MSNIQNKIQQFAEIGKFISTKLNFIKLNDTPTGYENGSFLTCNYSGIEYKDGITASEDIATFITEYDLIKAETNFNPSTQYLTTSHTGNSVINQLSFNNLIIGETYRMSSNISFVADVGLLEMQNTKVDFYHNGNKINQVYNQGFSSSKSTSLTFNATNTDLVVSGVNLDANHYIGGQDNDYISFVQLDSLSTNTTSPNIISIENGSTYDLNLANLPDSNFIKINGSDVSATLNMGGGSFVVAESNGQMIWDQGGSGETILNLGESINVILPNTREIEIKFHRSGSLYFALNKKADPIIPLSVTPTPSLTPTVTPSISATPTVTPSISVTPTLTPTISRTPSAPSCAFSPVTITVESQYDSETSTSTYTYTTSDPYGNGGLFGCIGVIRGELLTIIVTGDEPNLLSHPLQITNYNDLGQAMEPLSGVVKTDLTEGPYEDHTYSLTWVVPCDEGINKYQYQCENHAGMRGTINVYGECISPTPSTTPTVTPSITVTPTISATPTVTPSIGSQNYDTLPSTLPFKLK